MKIRKKMKQIVGSFLEEQGFSMPTGKEYQSSTAHCVYIRKQGGIEHIIGIGKAIFDQSIGFELQTSVWNAPSIKGVLLSVY